MLGFAAMDEDRIAEGIRRLAGAAAGMDRPHPRLMSVANR
jgi:hypothetical protein